MKQKKINDKLYVFDLEPYVISEDTDATVVYVQNHVYDAYKTLNPDLNIKRYNYNVIGVNKPEWYDYIDAQDEEPTPTPTEQEQPVITPTVPEAPVITETDTETDTPTETEPTFQSTTYSFVSYNPENHNEVWGTGKVITLPLESQAELGLGSTNGYTYTKVQVIENEPNTEFVGRVFYLTDSEAFYLTDSEAHERYYPLGEFVNNVYTHAGIIVRVYPENEIPSEAYPA